MPPHTTALGFHPQRRLFGVFQTPAQVVLLKTAVGALGVSRQHIHVLEGAPGLRSFGVGVPVGALSRFIRYVQGLTDERRETTKYIAALRRGLLVVLVDMHHDDARTKETLRLAFHHAGADSIDYFGNLVNEQLGR